MRVAVFGLGEAGSRFAADLAAAGVEVRGFDPADQPTPPGVTRCSTPADAVLAADLVLALTAAADAPTALSQAIGDIAPGTLYADCATTSAALKQSLSRTATAAGLGFVDVALMAIVPGNGLRTPALVSGPGAEPYAELLAPFGISIQSVGDEAGAAATRKLLRSVVMKGLAAVVIEAMRAGHASGHEAWLWDNVVDEIGRAGAPFLTRLVQGTGPHALRRLHEMEASAALLEELGVDPVMTRATVASLRTVLAEGLPTVPAADAGAVNRA